MLSVERLAPMMTVRQWKLMVVVDRWAAVAALADRSRRALYEYVRHADHPVSREEAARAAGMSRGLAAFHLDKLVDAGLLRAWQEAPPDQPRGRGRAPKVYELAGAGVVVTIPERRYELIAEILSDAVTADPVDARNAALRLARRRGLQIGARLPGEGGDLAGALELLGFEPRQDADGTVVLHNCPFHVLALRQTELVCGLNLAFVAGIVEGTGNTRVSARLAPRPGACCVQLTRLR
jgi:predicted ArsR family transcriptional regulator